MRVKVILYNKHCMLMQYIFFVVAVILLLVVGGILGFVYREKIVSFLFRILVLGMTSKCIFLINN